MITISHHHYGVMRTVEAGQS